jgi:hypothetical protein
VQANVTEMGKGNLNLQYTADGRRHEKDSDSTMLSRGYATVTPLLSVSEVTGQQLWLPVMRAGLR